MRREADESGWEKVGVEGQGRHGDERDGGVRRQRDNWLARAGSPTSRAWVKEGTAETEAGRGGGPGKRK